MTPKIDPETELPQVPGDRIDREIRDEELVRINTLSGKDVWDWGEDEEK